MNRTFKLFEEFLFEVLSLEEIKEKHYQSIPREKFDELIKADPTTVLDNNGIIKKMGKFSKWILNLYLTNEKLAKSEDLYKFTKMLDLFNTLNNKKILQKENIDNNIFNYKSLPELSKAISHFKEEDVKSNRDVEKEVKDKETTKVFENDECLVVIPLTHKSACYYGKGTEWCTASKDNDSYFNQYTSNGPLYIIIDKSNPEEEKYQFHLESKQFMDIHDYEMENYEIENVLTKLELEPFIKHIIVKLAESTLETDPPLIKYNDKIVVTGGSIKDLFPNRILENSPDRGSISIGEILDLLDENSLFEYWDTDFSDVDLTFSEDVIKTLREKEPILTDKDISTYEDLQQYKDDIDLDIIYIIEVAIRQALIDSYHDNFYKEVKEYLLNLYDAGEIEFSDDINGKSLLYIEINIDGNINIIDFFINVLFDGDNGDYISDFPDANRTISNPSDESINDIIMDNLS